MEADRRTDQLIGEVASGNYLSVRGIRPAQGRMLTAGDDAPSSVPVAVISDQLWRRRFGGEPVIGRGILLNRRNYTIVGVTEASAIGSFVGAPVDVWIPIGTSGRMLGDGWDVDRGQRTLAVIGRLRGTVTARQAEAELQLLADGIAREFTPDLHPVLNVLPGTLTTGDQRRLATMFLSLLLGLVGLVLVIACANVGNLLVARVLGRRRELAVRIALGASRARLARMLVIESLGIAAMGSAGALLLSVWTSRLLSNLSPLPTLTLRLDVRPDARVIAFTAIIATAAAAILSVAGTVQAIAGHRAGVEGRRNGVDGRTPARAAAKRSCGRADHRFAAPADWRSAICAKCAAGGHDRAGIRCTRRRRSRYRCVRRPDEQRESSVFPRRVAAGPGAAGCGRSVGVHARSVSTARLRSCV